MNCEWFSFVSVVFIVVNLFVLVVSVLFIVVNLFGLEVSLDFIVVNLFVLVDIKEDLVVVCCFVLNKKIFFISLFNFNKIR